jgi:hypothetical protein
MSQLTGLGDNSGARASAIGVPWEHPATHASARAARLVEWVSLLWWMVEPGEMRPANPPLAALAASWIAPHSDIALGLLQLVRGATNRDRIIKQVVSRVHGLHVGHDAGLMDQVIAALVNELEKLDEIMLGRFHEDMGAQIEVIRRRTRTLAEGLDPIRDVAAITREPCSLDVEVAPCLFLPPPQDGRHGVFLPLPEGHVVHLYFGFPLEDDLLRYGIDRQFLCSGAWHYALNSYLGSAWPPVAEALTSMHEVERAFADTLRADRRRPWPGAVEEHLKLAFRSHLTERMGGPRRHFRLLAQAFAATYFDWFVEWVDRSLRSERTLREELADLPRALAGALEDGSLTSASSAIPEAINLTIITQSRDALPNAVVPDSWDDALVARVKEGWRALSVPVLRHAAWAESPEARSAPVIAFGHPDDNPLVGMVLERRGMSVPDDGERTLLALLCADAAPRPAPWALAVASRRPESAAALTLEIAVRLTCSYAVLEGEAVVAADGITGGL